MGDRLSARQVIAAVLAGVEDGHDDDAALASADDVIHGLRVAGYAIAFVPVPAEQQLLADIRALVEESGLKQIHIAAKLGITPKHMSQLMTGKVTLTVFWAEQIAAVCGRQLDIRIAPISGEADHG